MVKMLAFAVVCSVWFLADPSAAQARLTRKWTYDQLLKEADLVVLAEAVRTEQAADEPPNDSWPRELVAQNATLKVRLTLKGKYEDEPSKVLHFKYGEPKNGIDALRAELLSDGPLHLITFRKEQITVGTGKDKQAFPAPEYLLFLKKTKDGRYAPVSGQSNPVPSIREVSKPLDKEKY